MKVKCSYCYYEWQGSGKTIYKCPNCCQMVITHSSLRNKPHELLKDITEVCGIQIFSDRTRIHGILTDVTQNKLVQKIIFLAIDDNIHGKLLNNVNRNIKVESLKHNFAKQNLLYKETAYYIVDSFAYALEISSEIDLSKYEDNWFTEVSAIPSYPVPPKKVKSEIEQVGLKYIYSFLKKQYLFLILLLILICGNIIYFYDLKNLPASPIITEKKIDTNDLIGYYSAQQTFGDSRQRASAQIIRMDGKLSLRFAIPNYPPQVMSIKLDIKNLKLETEHLGTGEIIFHQELNEIEIILRRESNIWVLRK